MTTTATPATGELHQLLATLMAADDIDDHDLELADSIVQSFPTACEALQARARIHLRLEDAEAARSDLQAAQALDAAHWGNAWVRCLLAHAEGGAALQEALTLGRQVLATHPTHLDTLITLGKVHKALDAPEEAAACYRQACQAHPASFRAHNLLMQVLCELGREDEAIALIRAAQVPMHSYHMAIEYNLGTLLMKKSPRKAIEFLDIARQKMGRINNVQHNRAACLEKLDRYQDAIDEWSDLLEREPDWDWPRAGRARCYRDLEQFDAALADLQRLKQADPTSTQHLTLEATIHFDRADYPAALKALQALEQANELQGEFLTNLLGATYKNMGELDAARPYFEQAIADDPESYRALNNLAFCLLHNGRPNKGEATRALAVAEVAMALQPAQWAPREHRARALLALDRTKEALQVFDAWCASHPDDGTVALNYATALLDAGDHAQAAQRFEQLIARGISVPYCHWGRGKALGRLGKKEEARALLLKAQHLYTLEGNTHSVEACAETLADLDKPKSWLRRLMGG